MVRHEIWGSSRNIVKEGEKGKNGNTKIKR